MKTVMQSQTLCTGYIIKKRFDKDSAGILTIVDRPCGLDYILSIIYLAARLGEFGRVLLAKKDCSSQSRHC